MSSISAGTTSGTALVSTGDTTGNLVLRTNTSTTAITLNTSGAIGVGTSPSFGTVGQVLTSAGSAAAPSWTTISSGGLTLLYTTSLTAGLANITYTNLPSSKQFIFVIPLADIDTTGGGGYSLNFQASSNNGSSYLNVLTSASTTDRDAPTYTILSGVNLSTYSFIMATTNNRASIANALTLLAPVNALKITPQNNSGATTFSGSSGRVAYLYSLN